MLDDNKRTMNEAGYKHITTLSPKVHVLEELETRKREMWIANKNHANYGIIYGNTHLEFARSIE